MILAELASVLRGAAVIGQADVEISDLAFDSRRAQQGSLFVALRGDVVDGHDFVEQARAAGAAAAMVEREEAVPQGMSAIVVRDAHAALAPLAHKFHNDPTSRVRLAGVTGTNGKTSVTYMLESMLAAAGRSPGVMGTVNYRFGGRVFPAPNTTPNAAVIAQTIDAMARHGVTDVVMEVSSHGLKLGRVDGCSFVAAAFTNFSRDHLDFHDSIEDYFESKALLFTRYLPASGKRARAAVLIDTEEGRRIARMCPAPVVSVSAEGSGEADLCLADLRWGIEGLSGTLSWSGESYGVRSPLLGKFVGPNLAVAAGLAVCLGLPVDAILRGAEALDRVPGRLEPVGAARDPLVLVDYAHTDGALRNAAEAAAGLAAARVITVFGCGGDRDRGKRPLMGRAAAEGSDLAIVTSDNPRTEDPIEIIGQILSGIEPLGIARIDPGASAEGKAYCVIPDRATAIEAAVTAAGPGDVVLIAGKGHEDYQIVGRTKRHFDDREEAAKAMAKRGPR